MTLKPLTYPVSCQHPSHRMLEFKQPKRCFFVMGVPSSATRLMGRLLEQAGCTSDIPESEAYDHRQLWEDRKPTEELIVMRRHIAIGRPPFWAQSENVIQALRMEGYDVYGIIMNRCQTIVEESMVAAPHVDSLPKARGQTMWSWQQLFRYLPLDCPFDIVSYEVLVKRPRQYLDLLGARWGLQFPDEVECITDGNEKYWEALRG